MNRQSAKKLAAFAIPFCALLLSVCAVQPPASYAFYYLKNDCAGKGAWIYKKLYRDTTHCAIAFFGTSHTLQAVNDSTLSTAYLPSVNLGYCRFGRDIQYELFRQAIEQKKIQTAIFEISETEASYSHPVYPYLAQGSDVFLPAFSYNQDFYHNRAEAFLFRLSYLNHYFVNKDSSAAARNGSYGFVPSFGEPSASYLQNQKFEKLKDLNGYNPNSFTRKAELSFSSHYFAKIANLASKNNCRVFFLYLPAFGNNAQNSLDSAFYSAYFPTLVPHDSILNNTRNWHDEAHLNNKGAAKLSNWLCKVLAETRSNMPSRSHK